MFQSQSQTNPTIHRFNQEQDLIVAPDEMDKMDQSVQVTDFGSNPSKSHKTIENKQEKSTRYMNTLERAAANLKPERQSKSGQISRDYSKQKKAIYNSANPLHSLSEKDQVLGDQPKATYNCIIHSFDVEKTKSLIPRHQSRDQVQTLKFDQQLSSQPPLDEVDVQREGQDIQDIEQEMQVPFAINIKRSHRALHDMHKTHTVSDFRIPKLTSFKNTKLQKTKWVKKPEILPQQQEEIKKSIL